MARSCGERFVLTAKDYADRTRAVVRLSYRCSPAGRFKRIKVSDQCLERGTSISDSSVRVSSSMSSSLSRTRASSAEASRSRRTRSSCTTTCKTRATEDRPIAGRRDIIDVMPCSRSSSECSMRSIQVTLSRASRGGGGIGPYLRIRSRAQVSSFPGVGAHATGSTSRTVLMPKTSTRPLSCPSVVPTYVSAWRSP